MCKKNRRIEVRRGDAWVETEMKEIRNGDVFRMFESNGDPVVGDGPILDGATEYIATEDAHQGCPMEDEGIWGCRCEPAHAFVYAKLGDEIPVPYVFDSSAGDSGKGCVINDGGSRAKDVNVMLRKIVDDDLVQLKRDVAAAFNKVSFEGVSNTPDFILAEVAVSAAIQFSLSVNRRELWYSNDPDEGEGESE